MESHARWRYDYPEQSCRSAAAAFLSRSPFLTEFRLGFRVCSPPNRRQLSPDLQLYDMKTTIRLIAAFSNPAGPGQLRAATLGRRKSLSRSRPECRYPRGLGQTHWPLTEQDLLSLTNWRAVTEHKQPGGLSGSQFGFVIFRSTTSLTSPFEHADQSDGAHLRQFVDQLLLSGRADEVGHAQPGKNLLTNLTLPAGPNGLSSLDLSQNRIYQFPSGLRPDQLTFLDLSLNGLINIPSERLDDLTALVIRGK